MQRLTKCNRDNYTTVKWLWSMFGVIRLTDLHMGHDKRYKYSTSNNHNKNQPRQAKTNGVCVCLCEFAYMYMRVQREARKHKAKLARDGEKIH